MAGDGAAPSAWTLPVRGTITQAFGPTTFALEPPLLYKGVYYPHFHDAIDFGTRLGQPVVAAAEGRVTFVGHLSDGAMVVVIAHSGGLVSVYAHLDDTFARPPVRIGDSVKANQVVGFVGLTGITTGPHLHFSVRRGGEPIDPLSLLTSR
jgi:murein DD-endopeptidase MepM/ murein hydrolase activator NlpD